MPAHANISQAKVKIGGQAASEELMDALEEIVVETALNLPAMALTRLHDPALKWVDDSSLDLGKEIEITLTAAGTTGAEVATAPLFKGEIVALEPEFDAQQNHTLVIRAYDRSHRLHIGRQTRTFLSITDSEIVQKLAGEAGLSADVDPTSVRHDWVLQNNQTNFEFLTALARRNGYELVLLADGYLRFKKPGTALRTGPELKLGEDLRLFRPRVSAARQSKTFEVRGWDYVKKQEFMSTATAALTWAPAGLNKAGGAAAQSAFGVNGTYSVVDGGALSVDAAKALAAGLVADADGEYVVAEGSAYGDSIIQAGNKVKISGVGSRFGGHYLVTSASHRYSKGSYDVHFTVSGRYPNTVNTLINHPAGGEQAQGRIYGVVPGLVTNLNDPDNLGRVKVKFGWMPTGQIESWWARIAAPMAGKGRGFFYLPEINDEVLLAFEQGDPHRPYIVGMLWNGKDKPPENNAQAAAGGQVVHRILQSRLGHKLVFDDSNNRPSILLQDKAGTQKITIDSTKNSITIEAAGDLTIDVKGNILIKAGQKIDIQAGLSISEKATTDYKLEALNASLKSTVKMDVQCSGGAGTFKALQTTVEGSVMLDLKGGPMVKVQGGMIMLN